jgi:hypothetical protein
VSACGCWPRARVVREEARKQWTPISLSTGTSLPLARWGAAALERQGESQMPFCAPKSVTALAGTRSAGRSVCARTVGATRTLSETQIESRTTSNGYGSCLQPIAKRGTISRPPPHSHQHPRYSSRGSVPIHEIDLTAPGGQSAPGDNKWHTVSQLLVKLAVGGRRMGRGLAIISCVQRGVPLRAQFSRVPNRGGVPSASP